MSPPNNPERDLCNAVEMGEVPSLLTNGRVQQRHPHTIAALRGLRGRGEMTLSELSRVTQLSRPTVATAIEQLIEEGWVAEIAADTRPGNTAGRPARRYRFRSDASYVAGIDVGLHKILVLLSDLDDHLVAEHQVELSANLSSADRVDAVAQAVEAALGKPPTGTRLLAAAVGAPGVVDRSGRIMVSPPMREWDGIDLGERLTARLHCPVLVENDVMAAAVGENRYGIGRGTRDFVYLLAGHRISCAAIINGRLHRGFTGAAGMVGELAALRWSDAPERLLQAGNASPTRPQSARDVFAAAAAGDRVCQTAVDTYLDDVAFGLAAVALAIDPELIVVGGGVSLAAPKVATTLRKHVAQHAKLVNPRIEISALGNRATALGGVGIAVDHAERVFLGTALEG
jgi:predicted NBD/HSP70 family sugar kinase